jgi:hypothetical protein
MLIVYMRRQRPHITYEHVLDAHGIYEEAAQLPYSMLIVYMRRQRIVSSAHTHTCSVLVHISTCCVLTVHIRTHMWWWAARGARLRSASPRHVCALKLLVYEALSY